jgi:ubiquitin carboxyl-terminal hydrolase 4/11/15
MVNEYRNGTAKPAVEVEMQEPPQQESEPESAEEIEANPMGNIFSQPSWSFNRPDDSADADQEDLFGDNDSNVAVEDGDSEPEDRLQELDNEGSTFEDVPTLLDDGSDDELPVVELRVGEDEK